MILQNSAATTAFYSPEKFIFSGPSRADFMLSSRTVGKADVWPVGPLAPFIGFCLHMRSKFDIFFLLTLREPNGQFDGDEEDIMRNVIWLHACKLAWRKHQSILYLTGQGNNDRSDRSDHILYRLWDLPKNFRLNAQGNRVLLPILLEENSTPRFIPPDVSFSFGNRSLSLLCRYINRKHWAWRHDFQNLFGPTTFYCRDEFEKCHQTAAAPQGWNARAF